jgi:hypothetical protein
LDFARQRQIACGINKAVGVIWIALDTSDFEQNHQHGNIEAIENAPITLIHPP